MLTNTGKNKNSQAFTTPLKQKSTMNNSSSNVYNQLHQILPRLTNNVVSTILERVTEKMDFENSFQFSAFFTEHKIKTDSAAYHVFESDNYREKIFRDAEKILYKRGYKCRLSDDVSGRYQKIHYSVSVMHPVQRMINAVIPMVLPLLVGYGMMTMSTYLSNRGKMHEEILL